MKNRFNNITSKEWLPFQKSWFLFQDNETLYSEHIRFFMKFDDEQSMPNIYYYGTNRKTLKEVAEKNKANIVIDFTDDIQYALIDLRSKIDEINTIDEFRNLKREILLLTKNLFAILKNRRFITILLHNKTINDNYYPLAWDLSYSISSGFSLKDEKIACLTPTDQKQLNNEVFYLLNFRKDENSSGQFEYIDTELTCPNTNISKDFSKYTKQWDIIKPPPRNKKEILHPAKFPENLIEDFIEVFSNENENIFDPMSGTGSTQLAALKKGRNGYGTELSEYFAKIANDRLEEYLHPKQKSLFIKEENNVKFKILNCDVREITDHDFPSIDYIITSPPYWDMLNMKGAENQAKRKEKGLKLNYSDNTKDLGNIEDYNNFLNELTDIYLNLIELLKPGGYITIIVKNIKKKGKNYPFAWDLTRKVSSKLIVLPEFFWLQDDINLAPYGYGNTFVSNTFHQYCLNFVKPIK